MDTEIIKKLSKVVILILLVSYTLDKLVFLALNKISDKVMTGQAIGKLNQFISTKDDAKFLVFGNSRANRNINVGLFDNNAFNIGTDGVGIAFNSTLINTLQEEKKQIILIHIDTKNFFSEDYKGSDIAGLKTKFKRDPKITEALIKSGELSDLQYFYYSMNYNRNAIGIIKNFLRPSYDYSKYNGFDPITISHSQEPMRDALLAKTLINKKCNDKHNLNDTALNYLKSIKTFISKSPNKTYLFVTSPIYNDFCSVDNIKLNEIMQNFNLTYWDFSNLYKENKDNSYWKDATHMSEKGANAFSIYLSERIEKAIK